MSKKAISVFHTELLDFLKLDAEIRCMDEEKDPSLIENFQTSLQKAFLPSSDEREFSLAEIIENYHLLLGTQESIHLERTLMGTFSRKEFDELGLSKYYPRIYRGLPRVYHSSHPARSQIKKEFTHLPSLKKAAVERAVFSLYHRFKIKPSAKVTIFTWMMNDGYGDYIAALEAAQLLKEQFPDLNLHLIALVPTTIHDLPRLDNVLIQHVSYDPQKAESSVPTPVLADLRSSALILQMPTFYPHTRLLLEQMRKIDSFHPFPKIENLGEYGYLESSWFHPMSGNRSLGLHFLEKGILIRKSHPSNFSELHNEPLLHFLFKTNTPGPLEIDKYLSETHFYLAYLTSCTGGAIYLHALLKSQERETKNIDLYVPDLNWFIQHVQKQNEAGRPVLEGGLSVGSLEVWFEGKIHTLSMSPKGKRVRILCGGPLSNADFRTLLSISGEFAAVRGDQSFSEAVSANKVFFYDGREHARYFIKDLLALAENRIATHRGSLTYFRGLGKTFLHQISQEEAEWVDETFFQEKEDWIQIALTIGLSLQNPDTIAGCKKLNRILSEEFSCNEFICHLIQRALCHAEHPEIETIEKQQLDLYGSGAQSFKESIKALQQALTRCYG